MPACISQAQRRVPEEVGGFFIINPTTAEGFPSAYATRLAVCWESAFSPFSKTICEIAALPACLPGSFCCCFSVSVFSPLSIRCFCFSLSCHSRTHLPSKKRGKRGKRGWDGRGNVGAVARFRQKGNAVFGHTPMEKQSPSCFPVFNFTAKLWGQTLKIVSPRGVK